MDSSTCKCESAENGDLFAVDENIIETPSTADHSGVIVDEMTVIESPDNTWRFEDVPDSFNEIVPDHQVVYLNKAGGVISAVVGKYLPANSMEIVESIANQCGPSTMRLRLFGFYIDLNQCSDKPNKENILRLMGQINALTFYDSLLVNSAQIFEISSQLTQIHLRGTQMDISTRSSFVRNYPLLRDLLIQENITSTDLEKLLELNSTIQTVKLLKTPITQEIVDIVSRLPELAELWISFPERSSYDVNLRPLGSMVKLKQLHLIDVFLGNDLLEELACKTSLTLTNLELFFATVPENFLKYLTKLDNLQTLTIIYVKGENGEIPLNDMFPYLVNELPKLRILYVRSEETMSYEDFARLFQARTKNSDLILFLNYTDAKLQVFTLENLIIFGPVMDPMREDAIIELNIDFEDGIDTIFEEVWDIVNAIKVVRL